MFVDIYKERYRDTVNNRNLKLKEETYVCHIGQKIPEVIAL